MGLEIRRRSPFRRTRVVELANDGAGYLPSRRAFEEGGYECATSPYRPGVGEQVVETALELLHRLHSL